MKGTAYGIGIGPGDPELMTLKAVRIIRENNVIAVPGKCAEDSFAYKIAVRSVPELADKILLPINMPMVKDKAVIESEHKKGAELIENYLRKGQNVVYLTLGDPTVYCSFGYLKRILENDGYGVELVSGVPSFCAAAAHLNIMLAEGEEEIHIFPSAASESDWSKCMGTGVIMKSGRYMGFIKDVFKGTGRKTFIAENCGTESERLYGDISEAPDEMGYFSIVIAKS